VKVIAISDAPISWPMTRNSRGCAVLSLVLCGDLVRAMQRESGVAIAHHWGVSKETVWVWRKALGVGQKITSQEMKRGAYIVSFSNEETTPESSVSELVQGQSPEPLLVQSHTVSAPGDAVIGRYQDSSCWTVGRTVRK
jgi:transposase-like protein